VSFPVRVSILEKSAISIFRTEEFSTRKITVEYFSETLVNTCHTTWRHTSKDRNLKKKEIRCCVLCVFEYLVAVILTILTLCGLVDRFQNFGEHASAIFYPEEGGSAFLQNVRTYEPDSDVTCQKRTPHMT
jgi:hypothetical protein